MTPPQAWLLATLLAFSLGPIGVSLWLANSVLSLFHRKRFRVLAGATVLLALLVSGWLPGLRLFARLTTDPGRKVTVDELFVLGYLSAGAIIGVAIVAFGRRRAPQPIPSTREEDLGVGKKLLALHRARKPFSPYLLVPGNQVYQVQHRDWEIPLSPGDRPLPEELDGFTILHLSDIHYGGYLIPEYFDAVRDHVAGLKPDMLIFTGDFLARSEPASALTEWLGGFEGASGALAVLGNHDFIDHAPQELSAAISKAGLRLLGGDALVVRRGGAEIGFAGLDYQNWWRPFPVEELRRKIPAGALAVLVTHTPCVFPAARAAGFQLVLCGHTHGGQIRLPGLGALLLPARYGRRYQMGLYHEGQSFLHVHPGVGGPPPVRWACQPEITRLILRKSTVESGQSTGR
jgi:hypothetical protein